MRRGTTPLHTFTLPFDTEVVEKVRVIYAQSDAVKVVKKECDVQMDGNEIRVKLSQKDTLSLNCKLNTDIQVKVLTRSGDSFVSDIVSVATDKCLYDEVL